MYNFSLFFQLRSSFTKAFSRGHKKNGGNGGPVVKEAGIASTGASSRAGERRESTSDVESRRESCSVPNSPLTYRNGTKSRNGSNRHSSK